MTSYLHLLSITAPEVLLAVSAIAVLAADLLYLRELPARLRLTICSIVATLGCAVAIGWLLALPSYEDFSNGMLALTPLRRAAQVGILVLTILTLLLSIETNSSNHVGEYIALVLFASVGMLFLVSSEDILLLFTSLELTSLCLYVLTAFNKQSVESAEAALKYFLFGGTSAAFTLFGLSLLYGLAHSTNLSEIAAAAAGAKLDPLLLVAIVMVATGFAFKIAAAPFHLWAPDVYQGAPLASAAFIASGSKVAGFVVLAQVMAIGFKGADGSAVWRAFQPGWTPVIAILAALSMLIGNLAALRQTSVRRLLAYSAVAHAGYLLLAVMAAKETALTSVVYYALTYALTALGAFGIVALVMQRTGNDRISDFAGLSRKQPLLSFCMAVFLLSLAGIPPLAGFFGKFYVFASALSGPYGLGIVWLVILALGMSAVSLYYYLKVLKQIYVEESPAVALTQPSQPIPVITLTVISIAALATFILGASPSLLLNFITGSGH